MEWNRIRAAHPDDEDVFHRNQQPANQDETLDLWVPQFGTTDTHLLDERVALNLRRGGPAGDKLEEIGEHVGVFEYCRVRWETQRVATSVFILLWLGAPQTAGSIRRSCERERVEKIFLWLRAPASGKWGTR
jgi:hypothetical protein